MYWVVLEWREQTGVEVMAIFDVDEDNPERCSYMIHYGFDMDLNVMGKDRWGHTLILWNLSEMSALRILLEATQHVLGILELPQSDAKILYCEKREQNCSIEEYGTPLEEILTLLRMTKYAQLLFYHFVRIEQVESALEPAMPLLEERTSVEGKFP